LDSQVKDLQSALKKEQDQVKEMKLKSMANNGTLPIEDGDKDDMPIMNQNIFKSRAISQKELEDLHALVKECQQAKDQAKKDIVLQANQFKAQVAKARDEKAEAQENLVKVEFLVGEKTRELERVQKENERITKAQE
jgi:hypothetical protein